MKLELTFGCIANSLNVDGIEEINMTDDQRKEVIKRIFEWYMERPNCLNSLLRDFLILYADEVDWREPCECCGDTIETYKMEI